jgi:TRAP-type uncharacterized transport system substrate-binding protein
MNGLFIILILATLLYFIYEKFKIKIYDEDTYKLGVLKNDKNILKYGTLVMQLSKDNIVLETYDNYDELMISVNNGTIDFGITYENYFIDSVLGLNSYENNIYKNTNFVTGLYFNYFQLISNIFIKDDNYSSKFTKMNDFKDFKKTYNRNLVIGTEDFKSISFLNLFILLVVFDFNPINYDKYDMDIEYNDNDIFYYIDTEDNLIKKMLDNKIDALFLFRTFNDKSINYIDYEKDVIYIDINFGETYFDQLFSIYYYKNSNVLLDIDTIDDLSEKIGFETRMSRTVMISNKNVKQEISYNMVKTIYGHNNYLTNVITNTDKTLDSRHHYFEPNQMAYINKNIPINDGSRKYFKELGFIISSKYIIDVLELKNHEKLKCYWKYKKIGLDKFTL